MLAAPQPSKAAGPIASSMFRMLADFPAGWRRTVTIDNGTELAQHYKLHELGVGTFLCDTRSPWQKEGSENSIGRMRRFLPGDTDLAALSADELIRLLRAYNNTTRKCLGHQTPTGLFSSQVLHLKCDSTVVNGVPRVWHDGVFQVILALEIRPESGGGRVSGYAWGQQM